MDRTRPSPVDLRRTVFVRTGGLVLLLVSSICIGLAVFAVAEERSEQTAHTKASALFLTDQCERLLLWDDRVALKALLEELVASRDAVSYAFVARGSQPYVHTFASGVPQGLLALQPKRTAPPQVHELRAATGERYYDVAVAIHSTGAALHLGVSRQGVDRLAVGRLWSIAGLGLVALIMGLGVCWGIAGLTARDVHRAERALRESEERYRRLFDQSPDSVLLLDPTDRAAPRIVDANLTACSMHGYARDELRTMDIGDLDTADDKRRVARRVQDIMGGAALSFEAEHRRKDGSTFPVEVIAQRIEIDGRPIIQALDRDISERRQAEGERARLEAQLQQAQKMEAIGRLAGGVAHDMNNILGAIMTASSVLRDQIHADHAHAEALDHVLMACRRGRDLARNLLGFARKGKYVRRRINLNAVAGETLALLRHGGSPNVEVHQQLDPTLPAVEGDRSQLQQAVMNVLINALDAMGDTGTLTVTTRRSTLPGRGHGKPVPAAELCVRDSGCGIAPDALEHVFEPFFTTKPAGEGTGLGLAMVYGAMQHHQGSVTLDSQVGRGTAVRLRLPSCSGPADEPSVSGPPVERHRGEQGILLVDDEPLARFATRLALERLGYRVWLAEGGPQAIERLTELGDSVSLVLLDFLMPGMDGPATFARLREIDPSIKVLVMSGFARDDKVEALLEAGAVGFLEKPADMQQIAAEVRAALAGAAPPAEA